MKKKSNLSKISALETFDEAAFFGSEDVPQDVCNLVLTLACIYNDYNDRLMALDYLEKAKPPEPPMETSQWGVFNGVKMHGIRILVAVVHELLQFVEKKRKTIKHPFFELVVSKIDSTHRESWEMLVKASHKDNRSHGIAITLHRAC